MLMLKRYDATQKILGSQEELFSLQALMALREAMLTQEADSGIALLSFISKSVPYSGVFVTH